MASGALKDYLGFGVIASRPATPSLATGVAGYYYATDTGVLSLWNGSAWTNVSSGAGGSINIQQAGSTIVTGATVLNFASGATVAASGTTANVNIAQPPVMLNFTGSDVTASATAANCKGVLFNSGAGKIKLTGALAHALWVNTQHYYMIVGVSTVAAIVSILGTSSTLTGFPATTSPQYFAFPSVVTLDPSTLASNQFFFALVVCTDGTGGTAYAMPISGANDTSKTWAGLDYIRQFGCSATSLAPAVATSLGTVTNGFRIHFYGYEALP